MTVLEVHRMATTGGSWFSANTLVNHSVPAKSVQAQNEGVRNDPNTLVSFYDAIPKEDIALPQFEEWGIARLRSAHQSQLSVSQALTDTDSRCPCSFTRDRTDSESQQEASRLPDCCKQLAGQAHEGETSVRMSALTEAF